MSDLEVRVYYADTDAGGVLYHGATVTFLDRGRIEWLRQRNLQPSDLQERFDCALAVHELQVRYLRPAYLDEMLTVHTELAQAGAASLWFSQDLSRDGERLVQARVRVACVRTTDGRACPLPAPVRALGDAHD